MALGTVLGYSSPAGIILTSNSTDSSIHLTDSQNSWFSSISNVGALLGGPAAGLCVNMFGRKGTMIFTIVPFLIGWALIIAAQNFAMLLLGRILTGLCGGGISLSVNTYMGEITSPHIRGLLGTGFQLMVVTGVLFAYCMGAAFDSFRWIAAVCAIVPCIHSALMIFNKESPTYLLSKGKDAEAEESLRYFRGKHYTGIATEMSEMKEALEKSRQRKMTLSDLKAPHILKPLLMCMGLMLFQQLSGINAVLFNLGIIFKEAGSDMSSTLSSIIVGLVQVLATFAGSLVSDKAGRKFLLSISAGIMALSLAALGTFFYLLENDPDTAANLGWLPLVSLIIFIIAFSIGYGPVPWIMMSELFSLEAKELAGAISTTTNWTMAFVTTFTFSPLQSAIYDYGVYWMYACFCLVNLLFVLTFVYETKGKTFAQIAAHFGGPLTTEQEKREEAEQSQAGNEI
ncbi:UNVERIFIED_CONTAM: hypothetical protein GTU68_021577 [Idotea baltica]|nr:hypothetical protein [Idotea baltica]